MSDSFEQATSVGPQRIGNIEIRLVSPDPGGPHAADGPMGDIRVQVIYDGGEPRERRAKLQRHVSTQVIQQLTALLATLRAKAEAEILPIPQGGNRDRPGLSGKT